jgi:hypothetical protein
MGGEEDRDPPILGISELEPWFWRWGGFASRPRLGIPFSEFKHPIVFRNGQLR